MELTVKPVSADIVIRAVYKEAMLGLAQESLRLPIVKKFLELFKLRLDDLKFDQTSLSGNFLKFTKAFGTSLFDVSFGFEEISARLWRTESEDQALDLFQKLFLILAEFPISTLTLNISHQFSTEGNVDPYLQDLSPKVPKGFQDILSGRGMLYNLRIPEHDLKIYITLANSLFVENGLFLALENQFTPFTGDFNAMTQIVLEKYNFILTELGIKIHEEK